MATSNEPTNKSEAQATGNSDVEFWIKVNNPKEKKEDKSPNHLDNAVKIIGVLISIAGIFIGIDQFNKQQANNNALEFRRKLWDKKFELYTQIGKVAVELGTSKEDTTFRKKAMEFRQIYGQALPLFFNDTVSAALKEFNFKVKDRLDGIEDTNDPQALDRAAANLLQVCQQSLSKSMIELEK